MEYFTISELCASSTARAKGIINEPTKEVEENLKALIENVLDPIRMTWGAPIIVNSGYRCEALNKAVGGAKTSQHMKGQAADIVPTDKTRERVKELFELIVTMGKNGGVIYDQLINESDYSWVHISYRKDGGNRMQRLKL